MPDTPLRILILDDDGSIARALEHAGGHETSRLRVEATSADEAFRHLADATPAAGGPILVAAGSRLREEIDALRTAAAHYKALYEDAPDMSAVIHSGTRTVVECNGRLARTLGLPATDVVGRHVHDLHAAGCGTAIDDLFARLEHTGEIRDAELQLRAVDDELIDVSVNVTRVSHGDGPYLRASWRDISRRKAAERQLVSFARELERSNRELEQFAYVASHDLKEPLRMIASYLQLLERRYADELDDDARDFIGFAVDGAHRMRRLIADLLAYSRVGNRELTPVLVDPRAVIDEVLQDLRGTIDESGATIEVHDLPMLTADVTHVRQLFQNLIANALKFRGRDAPRVAIRALRSGAEWTFTVTDNGVGIPPEERERIFRVFQRLHAQEKYPGTGIGLAICKKIVERHGGHIDVEPAPGGGSVFSFTFPPTEESSDGVPRAA